MQNQIIIGREFPEKVIPLIEASKKSIKIVVYDWRWYENDPGNAVQLFNQSIIRAARRGVSIQAIVNNDRIALILNSNGVVAKKINVSGIVHSKLLIIDDDTVVVGSHNYTHSAFVVNQEISVALSECEKINDVNNYFQSLWQS